MSLVELAEECFHQYVLKFLDECFKFSEVNKLPLK